MLIEQYLEMARVAAAGILDKRRERQWEVVHSTSLPLKIVIWCAALGVNAANWLNTLDDFEQLFQCGSPRDHVVDTPEEFREIMWYPGYLWADTEGKWLVPVSPTKMA